MPWFLVAAIFAGALFATILLAPKIKTEQQRPSTLDDLQFPRASEGDPIPLILGKGKMDGPNTLWVGDFVPVAIKKKQKTGLFSSKKVTVGFTYYIGLDLGLALGPCTLHRIWIDKEEVWSGAASGDGDAIQINKPDLFGGKEKGGGFVGTLRYYAGTTLQSVNAYVEKFVGVGRLPAYRGTAHIVFEHVNIGESNQLRAVSFEMSRYSNALGLPLVGEDLNPMELLYQAFTLDWGGLNVDPDMLDTTSLLACAETLHDEGNGMSLVIASANAGKDIAAEVIRQIDGLLYENPQTGKIVCKLIRNDYDIDELPVFDESNIVSVQDYTAKLWEDTINQVRVTYTNREKKYEQGTTIVQDLANINAQKRIRSTLVSYPGVTNGTLATEKATTELSQMSVPLLSATLEMNRDGVQLRPGDCFVWAWKAFRIERVVMRVQEFDLGSLDDNRVLVSCVQDEFAVDETIFAPPSSDGSGIPSRSPGIIDPITYLEIPYFFDSRTDAPAGDGLSKFAVLAKRPNAFSQSFKTYASETLASEVVEIVDDGAYAARALLTTPFAQFAGFTTGTLPNLTIEAITDADVLTNHTFADIQEGFGFFVVHGEFMAYETFTDNGNGTHTLHNIYRALLDSDWATGAAGDAVWFFDGQDNFFDAGIPVGTPRHVRSIDLTDAGTGDLATAVDAIVTPAGRAALPLAPDYVTVEGERTTALSATAGDALTIAWRDRNRTAPLALETDAAVAPEEGTTYRVRVYVGNELRQEESAIPASPYELVIVPEAAGNAVIRVYAERDIGRSIVGASFPIVIAASDDTVQIDNEIVLINGETIEAVQINEGP